MARQTYRRYTFAILLSFYVVLWALSNYSMLPDSMGRKRGGFPSYYTYSQVQANDSEGGDNTDTVTASHGHAQWCVLKNPPPRRRVTDVDCKLLLAGDALEQGRAIGIGARRKQSMNSDAKMVEYTSNCSNFLPLYRPCPSSEEEAQYPIAYSILCHKDASQVERLLRALYQPQNVYCIHTDAKSSYDFRKALENIANCFPNVFIASKLERVVYSSYSRLQADINCMQDLVTRPEKWVYLINLVGQVFPLKTNREIMQILKIYNGTNDIEGLAADKIMKDRLEYYYAVKKTKRGESLYRQARREIHVPGNLTLIRGSAYGVFSRAFLDFVLTDRLAKELLEWSKDTKTPDEHYWATLHQLHHNPSLNSPGGYRGRPENNTWLASFSKWQHVTPCGGKYVHYVCVFGVKDLPDLVSRQELFANKFYADYQPLAIDCLEEWINNRTIEAPEFNLTLYRNLPFVREHG